MALATVQGIVVNGVRGELVRVEVAVSDGLPSIGIVGLPDASVSEAKWRARCAVDSAGKKWPDRRITVSLSPAELRKHGAGLDLPISVGVLAAADVLPRAALESTAFLGELGLDGRLHRAQGTLAALLAAREAGLRRVIVSSDAAFEVAGVPGIEVQGARTLAQVCALLSGEDAPEDDPATDTASTTRSREPRSRALPDLADVRGQGVARWALEVAAVGGHHMAMVGAPGVGKTMVASRLPGILPALDDDEALEVAAIHSVVGTTDYRLDDRRPPLQSPHHSASAAALLGSTHGGRALPGAVTLAHHGVLFLDEAPEFCRPALEGLRQPLESGVVALHRAQWSGTLPARFQLILAANPCPCGQRTAPAGCSCSPTAVRRYASRLSGPLIDRIDIRLSVQRPSDADLTSVSPPESSADVGARVKEARRRSHHRLAGTPWRVNADVPAGELRGSWAPDPAGAELLRDAERRAVNLRGTDRVLRLAWTLADMAGRDRPGREEIAGALSLRGAQTAWA